MIADQRRISEFAGAFARHLPGSAAEREQRRAELVEHLMDAAEAGELDEALRRLGDPHQAAVAFAPSQFSAEARFARRIGAALVDNLPLLAVAVAIAVQGLARDSFTLAFPPFVHLQVGGVCVSTMPAAGCIHDDPGWIQRIAMPLALAWSIVGLAVLESRTGTTPGKRLAALRTLSETGLLLRLGPAVVRRTSFLLGPVAWLDWLPFLTGRRRRMLDHLVVARVVTVRRGTL
ncbi:RDD family protein [Catellatospora sichuanensis]|uniref:RDD family protein n=1 Tax=Catellatospora sichuanensis TaxID=1969805 RepID=UPI00118244C0|nr:RDD family protein [Catellatospora sichuanensis]